MSLPSKPFIISTVLVILLAVGSLPIACSKRYVAPTRALDATSQQRPNVLLISADDLNTDLGCYGNHTVRSPNIDRLAERGIRFQRAYCQFPLCNPSRTSFLSGLRPQATGVLDNDTDPRTLLGNVPFFPEYFHGQGYFTATAGKIVHPRFRNSISWDRSIRAGAGGEPDGGCTIFGQDLAVCISDRSDSELPDGAIAHHTIDLLEQNKDRQFLIAAGFHRPHLPWIAPRKYYDLYSASSIETPGEGRDGLTHAQRQQARRAYYACISFLDAQVGAILDALDRLDLARNTIVALVADHGFSLGEHGLWKKMNLSEQTARVPFIMAGPGIPAGAKCAALTELVDLYPTLAEACGLPIPPGLEGSSLAPLLAEPARQWKKAAFTEMVDPATQEHGRSIRTDRYAYIEWTGAKSAELYDLDLDPQGLTNRAKAKRYKDTKTELKRLLDAGWLNAKPPGS